jgi:hypothetical protein
MTCYFRSLRQIVSDYPYSGAFDETALCKWIAFDKNGDKRFGSHLHINYKGKVLGWVGKKGWIEDASLNVKWHYMRCMEEHGSEDAAKEWVWLQGYSVSSRKSHVEAIIHELFKAGHTKGLDCIGGSTARQRETGIEPVEPIKTLPW